jgi:hypothetical protein
MSYKLKVDYEQCNQALLQCASNKMMISHTLDASKYLVFDQPLANLWPKLWWHQLGWKKNTNDYSILQPHKP